MEDQNHRVPQVQTHPMHVFRIPVNGEQGSSLPAWRDPYGSINANSGIYSGFMGFNGIL